MMEYVAYQTGFVAGRLSSLLESRNLSSDDREVVRECVEALNGVFEHMLMKEEPDV